jgi:hypothetical protein
MTPTVDSPANEFEIPHHRNLKIDTDSVVSGDIPPSLMKPPPSNEAIFFNWGVLTGPRLPSHIPF